MALRLGNLNNINILYKYLLKPTLIENSNVSAGIEIPKDPDSVDTINQNKFKTEKPRTQNKSQSNNPIINDLGNAENKDIDLKRNNIYSNLKLFCEEKINGEQLKIALKDIGVQPASSSLPKVGYFSPEQEHIIDQQEISGRRVLKDLVKIFLATSTDLYQIFIFLFKRRPAQARTKMIVPTSQNVFNSGLELPHHVNSANYDLKLKSADTFKWHVDTDSETIRPAHKYVPSLDTNSKIIFLFSNYNRFDEMV